MTGDNAARRAEDIGGQELSYAEVKAIASGNPAVLTLAEADAELQRLTILKKNHADEQYLARRSLRVLPETIDGLSQRLSALTADMTTTTAHAADRVTIANRTVPRGDAADILAESLHALPERVWETRRVPLGVYRGLRFGMVLHPQFPPDVFLEGRMTRQSMLSREHHGAHAILNALERLAGGYSAECERVRQDLAIAEAQLRDYQARLGVPFAHDAYLSRLSGLREQLKAGLAGVSPNPSAESPLTVLDLAEQIKMLRATHAIELAPRRAGSRLSAEEPVTSRIRRRIEMASGTASAIEPREQAEFVLHESPMHREAGSGQLRA